VTPKRQLLTGLLLTSLLPLAGCGALERLSEIGRPPAMTPITDPTRAANYRPLTTPLPKAETTAPDANSLWRPGARAFFKDQRAAQVGDLITVLVNIADTAALQDQSSTGRTGTETLGMPNFFGLEALLPKIITSAISPKSLVSTNSAGTSTGTGAISRTETITLRLAGEVTQVLPNGNLVINASQEMRVNSELRELSVKGIVRPQDIASDNTVTHDRMAEARISYGGRGQITDYQTPRAGQQVLDTVLPF
jgi:flagellar L-ring protein precursor FlgH